MAISIALNACVEENPAKFNSRKFLKHYKSNENVIGFSLPAGLIRVFVDRDEKELRELLKQIDDMQFLIFDDDYFHEISPKKLFAEMDKELESNQFVDVLIVKEKDELVKFKIQEENSKVKEIIMLVSSQDEVIVMNISGNIDLTKIDLITESFDINKVKDYH